MRFVWVFGLALMACGERSVLSPPSAPTEAVSFAYLWQVDDGTRSLAFEGAPPPLEVPSNASLTWLAYDVPLSELDLTAGPITSDVSSPCRRLQPLSKRAFFAGDEADPWRELDELPEWAADHLVSDHASRCDACIEFASTLVSVEAPDTGRSTDVEFLATLESGAVLAGVAGPAGLIRLTRDGGTRLEGCDLPSATPGFAPDGDNRFWVGGGRGELHLVSIDEASGTCSIQTSTVAPVDTILRWLAASPPDAPLEVFALGHRGELLRFDEAGWSRAEDLPLHPQHVEGGSPDGGLIWLGPGEVMANVGPARAYRWSKEGGVTSTEIPVLATANGLITVLSKTEGLGIVAGSSDGSAWQLSNDRTWIQVEGTPAQLSPAAFVDFQGRVLGVLKGAGVIQHTAHFGFCPTVAQVGQSGDKGGAVAVTGRSLVLGKYLRGTSGVPERVFWVDVAD